MKSTPHSKAYGPVCMYRDYSKLLDIMIENETNTHTYVHTHANTLHTHLIKITQRIGLNIL